MDNLTLQIDPETHDLVLDETGGFVMIGGAETVGQCVRATLEVFQGEWFLDLRHGTDYEQIIGDGAGDPETILRAAIFQEPEVRFVDTLTVNRDGRRITSSFSARLTDGTAIGLEVSA